MKYVSLLVLGLFLSGCVAPSCERLREDVVNAKERRAAALTAGDQVLAAHYQAEIQKAAASARNAGCSIDDLIGPDVGK